MEGSGTLLELLLAISILIYALGLDAAFLFIALLHYIMADDISTLCAPSINIAITDVQHTDRGIHLHFEIRSKELIWLADQSIQFFRRIGIMRRKTVNRRSTIQHTRVVRMRKRNTRFHSATTRRANSEKLVSDYVQYAVGRTAMRELTDKLQGLDITNDQAPSDCANDQQPSLLRKESRVINGLFDVFDNSPIPEVDAIHEATPDDAIPANNPVAVEDSEDSGYVSNNETHRNPVQPSRTDDPRVEVGKVEVLTGDEQDITEGWEYIDDVEVHQQTLPIPLVEAPPVPLFDPSQTTQQEFATSRANTEEVAHVDISGSVTAEAGAAPNSAPVPNIEQKANANAQEMESSSIFSDTKEAFTTLPSTQHNNNFDIEDSDSGSPPEAVVQDIIPPPSTEQCTAVDLGSTEIGGVPNTTPQHPSTHLEASAMPTTTQPTLPARANLTLIPNDEDGDASMGSHNPNQTSIFDIHQAAISSSFVTQHGPFNPGTKHVREIRDINGDEIREVQPRIKRRMAIKPSKEQHAYPPYNPRGVWTYEHWVHERSYLGTALVACLLTEGTKFGSDEKWELATSVQGGEEAPKTRKILATRRSRHFSALRPF